MYGLILVLLCGALNFNGSTQYIRRANALAGQPTSYVARFHAASITANGTLVAAGDVNVSDRIWFIALGNLTAPDDPIAAIAIGTGADNVRTNYAEVSPYATDRWYSAAAVFTSNTSRRIWHETLGTALNTNAVTEPTGLDNLNIGRLELAAASNYFEGKIADVKVYNRAINEAEVKAIWYGSNQVPRGLLGWWLLLESAGTPATFVDLSGNGNTMTNNGTTTTVAGPPLTWQAFSGQ